MLLLLRAALLPPSTVPNSKIDNYNLMRIKIILLLVTGISFDKMRIPYGIVFVNGLQQIIQNFNRLFILSKIDNWFVHILPIKWKYAISYSCFFNQNMNLYILVINQQLGLLLQKKIKFSYLVLLRYRMYFFLLFHCFFFNFAKCKRTCVIKQ
jgi:hypothetical protein